MFYLLILLIGCAHIVTGESVTKYNERPVIGILSEPNRQHTEFYIAASYVKWLEAAGASSIVIPFDADEETVEHIFTQINGVLLPSGSAISHVPISVKKIISMAKKANDDGDKFPIWGTCLGFEYLIMVLGDHEEKTIQSGFDAMNISLPLNFTDAVRFSRAFANEEVKRITATEPVTFNYHTKGIEPERFSNDARLASFFHMIATSSDRAGRHFVSAIEGKSYPFYGVQFHPEKASFERATVPGTNNPYQDINHSGDAVQAMFQLGHFFVSEARQNRGGDYTNVTKYPSVWAYESVRDMEFEDRGFEQRFIISRKETKNIPRNETMSTPYSIMLGLLIFAVWMCSRRCASSKSTEEKGLLLG